MLIHDLLTPPPIQGEQRVEKAGQQDACEAEQRVIDDTPIITIPHFTKAEPIVKRMLKITPRLHQQVT
jgi:hypothetical protein